MFKDSGQSGNVMLAMFATIGMVGVVGATSMTIMKGPVRGMSEITKRTIAENNMIASGRLAIMATSNQPQSGDCDADNTVEPIAWTNTGTGPKPTGGGYIPSNIGAAIEDPWRTTYGYCVWDHGAAIQTTCGTPTQRLRGTGVGGSGPVITLISAGADRIFQTTCADAPTYVTKPSGSDDIVMTYSYAEAQALGGGLWNLQDTDLNTAEIKKDLEVKNASGNVVFGVDATTTPTKPSIKVDYMTALSQPRIESMSPLRVSGTNMTLDLLSGTSTSSYTGSIGINDDGFNITNNSASRGFNLKNTNGTLLNITAAGNVGIGLAPSQSLHADANIRADGRNYYFGANQRLYGDNSSAVVWYSNHSTETQMNFFDLEGASYGRVFGNGDGANFGLLDGDGNWSYLAVKDSDTRFYINNAIEMRLFPTYLDVYAKRVTNLATPTAASDAATKAYVDANIAAGTGFTEQDPQVAAVTLNKHCRGTGSQVTCDVDDDVGAVTNGKWCRGNGSQVICDQDPPTGGVGWLDAIPASTTCSGNTLSFGGFGRKSNSKIIATYSYSNTWTGDSSGHGTQCSRNYNGSDGWGTCSCNSW